MVLSDLEQKAIDYYESTMRGFLIIGIITFFIVAVLFLIAIFYNNDNNVNHDYPCPSCPDCRHPQIIIVNESQVTESGGYLYYAIE